MTLGFSQRLKIGPVEKQSYFREKILACYAKANAHFFKPKLHTIREDKDDVKERWRIGMLIHFVYGNRTKNRVCWHTGTCTFIEYIAIVYPPCCGFTVYIFNPITEFATKLTDLQIEQLAINDGFDSVEDFKHYFDKDFKGKIIHWTDIRYGR